MKHNLYKSVEEMLTPETLSHLAGTEIRSLTRVPCGQGPFSGSFFTSIKTNDGVGPSYLLKEISYERDWMMRHSNDRFCRSVTLWQAGLLDQLRPEIEHSVVACVKEEGDKEHKWAILMHDVSAGNTSWGVPITRAQHKQILDAMAALHATFWQSPEIDNPALGIASYRDVLPLFMVRNILDNPGPFGSEDTDGWPMLMEMVTPDVAEILDPLMREPQPLCDALARYPRTLLHGDFKTGNMSLKPNPQMETVVYDWQLATVGAATMDLFWYLTMSRINMLNIIHEKIPDEESIAYYRQTLANRLGTRFDESYWQPMLELSYLDIIIRTGSYHAWSTVYEKEERTRTVFQHMVAKYDEQVRRACKWL